MVFTPVAKPEPDALQRQEASIARRRALEAQRKKTIFDAKIRTIGVDVQGLNGQVADHEQRQREEHERNQRLDREALDIARQLTFLQREKQRRVAERNAQVQAYRELYQARHETRDYDLSDPALRRKQQPPRLGDDEELPASSLQMFAGEDLRKRERVQVQQRELSEWANYSVHEKELLRSEEQAKEEKFAADLVAIDMELERLQLAKQANIRLHNVRVQNYNKDLDQSVNKARQEQSRKDEELSQKELLHNQESDWLNERYETTKRVDRPKLYQASSHSYIPWNFKGYSVDECQKIYDEQAAQIEEKRRMKEVENQKSIEQDQEILEVNRQLILTTRIRQRNDLKNRIDVRNEQNQQRREFKSKYDYINNELYQNKVDDYVFDCFGTSTR